MIYASRFALFVFPLAALLNSFSMTALLLIVGVAGRSELAADIGLVQGATLAVFYAFSANARNLILADAGENVAMQLLKARLILVLPITVAAYFLSVGIGTAAAPLAMALIGRRISEWIGEIALARHERLNQPVCALQTLAVESASFLLCLVLVLGFGVDLAWSAIPWMLAPLLAIRRAGLSLSIGKGGFVLALLLPHFGSTAIIGISVYVFRISIALLTGKSIAGELFTAFAIGGVIPTIFGHALAPTLAHRYGRAKWPKWLLVFPLTMLLAASGLAALAIAEPVWLQTFGRSTTFWLAVCLSIAGGAIMTVAAGLRTRLIHRDDGREVFGPDLFANLLIATCVPFVNYLFGSKSLAGLYALSACLSLGFLWRAGCYGGGALRHRATLLYAIGLLLVLPVFFQFNGGLFQDAAFVFDSGGVISRLPFPVSVLALFGGVALLGNYVAATQTLTVLFFTAISFMIASLSAAQGNSTFEGAKLILLAQFMLPMFGLILGQMYGAAAQEPFFERAALVVLLFIIPAQLAATWIQGYALMSPKVFVFSIYQHLLYFPMVIAALTMMIMPTIVTNGGRARLALSLLIPLLAVQIVATLSMSAIAGFVMALAMLVFFVIRKRAWVWQTIGIALIAVLAGAAYWPIVSANNLWKSVPNVQMERSDEFARPVVTVIGQKVPYWRYYTRGIVESPGKFLVGHATPPDRARYPSAQNYWLDAAYNFGVIAVLPLFALLFWTGRSLWQRRGDVLDDPLLFGAAMAAVSLLIGENMLKIGMRQPYPGIITFFIWGLLLARLNGLSGTRDSQVVNE
jgi:hypothetical protein